MRPPIDVLDDPLRGAKRVSESLFKVIEFQRGHERFRRNAFQTGDVFYERAKRCNGRRHERRYFLGVSRGPDVALAEMQHMTPGLHLARAPQILFRNDDVAEE